jgi:two-component system, response regulator PdtaR
MRARAPLTEKGKNPVVKIPSILVVDDEALIRMDVVYIVEDAGYSAVEAANADEAIVMLEGCPGFTAVLTDINMPGTMDGLQLSRMIRDRWPLIGIVVTSGRFVAKAAQMPAGVQFIAKPYTPTEIIAALHDCAA